MPSSSYLVTIIFQPFQPPDHQFLLKVMLMGLEAMLVDMFVKILSLLGPGAWCTSQLRVFLPQSQGGFFPFKGFPVSPWGQKGIARGGERRETSSTLLREGPFELTRSTFGHCPNSDLTPPPHSGAELGNLRKFAKLPFWR